MPRTSISTLVPPRAREVLDDFLRRIWSRYSSSSPFILSPEVIGVHHLQLPVEQNLLPPLHHLDGARVNRRTRTFYLAIAGQQYNGVRDRRSSLPVDASLPTLLQISIVPMGHKSLCPQASGSSLILHCYSGSTVATGRSHPSLLWSVAAMGTVMTVARRYCGL
jgi:hypothetical protein